MNSLEIIKKLYEEEADASALEDGLDEASREELRQLVEARDALASLTRRKPSSAVVDAVVASSRVHRERPSALFLLLSNRTLHQLAAAAVVVVAIGIGYLTLTTDGLMPVDKQDIATMTSETRVAESELDGVIAEKKESQEPARQRSEESMAKAVIETPREAPAAPSAPEAGNLVTDQTFAENADEARFRDDMRTFAADADEARFGDNMRAFAAGAAISPTDSFETPDAELVAWDEENKAMQTFFWQVQALDGRSPDEDWEEAVPLEGSFRRLERQRTDGGGWLQTGTEK